MTSPVRAADRSTSALPGYAAMLDAYHRAFAAELEQVVAGLPLGAADRALDVACGDGCYTRWIARRAKKVIGVDVSSAYLELARELSGGELMPLFLCANAGRLPFAAAQFDLTFCAQSFASLGDPLRVLSEMQRVTRPGGRVVILENDSLHHVLIPWPPALELAVRQAELLALAALPAGTEPARYYVARNLGRWLREAGVASVHLQSFVIARQAPLGESELAFLALYFDDLGRFVWPHLDARCRDDYARLLSPGSPDCLFEREDFSATYLETLAIGSKLG